MFLALVELHVLHIFDTVIKMLYIFAEYILSNYGFDSKKSTSHNNNGCFFWNIAVSKPTTIRAIYLLELSVNERSGKFR